MKTNVKKIIVAFILMLNFVNAQANGEDDQTIIAQGYESYLQITAKAGSENSVTYVRMYNLSNPAQFNKVLVAESCNESNNVCVYTVANTNIVEGNVYRIEMYYSGSETPFVIQYIQ